MRKFACSLPLLVEPFKKSMEMQKMMRNSAITLIIDRFDFLFYNANDKKTTYNIESQQKLTAGVALNLLLMYVLFNGIFAFLSLIY